MITFPLLVKWGEAIKQWAADYQLVVWDPRDPDFSRLTNTFEDGILNLEGIGRPRFLALLYAPDDYEWAHPLAAFAVVDTLYAECGGWVSINELIGVRCLAMGVTYTLS